VKTNFDEEPTVTAPAGGKLVAVVGTPTDGDVVTYVGANSRYEPVAGGGGSYTDEQAQDAVGAMVDGTTLEYVDATPLLRVKDEGITFAKMQNIATARILGRDTTGSGDIEELTAAEVLAMLGSAPSPGSGLPYMYPFVRAIDDPVNDNFRVGDGAGGMDTAGTRFSGAGAWTAENIGASTVSVADGLLQLTSPSSASIQIRGYYQAVPSGNWCICMPLHIRPGNWEAGQRSVGMYLRDSSSGKIETWAIAISDVGAHTIWAGKFTNATTYSVARSFTSWGLNIMPHFLEIEYDGTNYYFRFANCDAEGYRFLSFAKTNFLSAAADGIGVFSENDQSDATTLFCRGFYRVATSTVL
jgi:hypothetical protein